MEISDGREGGFWEVNIGLFRILNICNGMYSNQKPNSGLIVRPGMFISSVVRSANLDVSCVPGLSLSYNHSTPLPFAACHSVLIISIQNHHPASPHLGSDLFWNSLKWSIKFSPDRPGSVITTLPLYRKIISIDDWKMTACPTIQISLMDLGRFEKPLPTPSYLPST